CSVIRTCSACSKASCFYVAVISGKCRCLKSLDFDVDTYTEVVLPSKPCRRFMEEMFGQELPDNQDGQSRLSDLAICSIIFGVLGAIILFSLIYRYRFENLFFWRNCWDGLLDLWGRARYGTDRAFEGVWRGLFFQQVWALANWRAPCAWAAAWVGRVFRPNWHERFVELWERARVGTARTAEVTCHWIVSRLAWVADTCRGVCLADRGGSGIQPNIIDLELGEIDPAPPLPIRPQYLLQNPEGENGWRGDEAEAHRIKQNTGNARTVLSRRAELA
ncbi:unnamed protein product, partial [Allacma fusca]